MLPIREMEHLLRDEPAPGRREVPVALPGLLVHIEARREDKGQLIFRPGHSDTPKDVVEPGALLLREQNPA